VPEVLQEFKDLLVSVARKENLASRDHEDLMARKEKLVM